MTWLLVSTYPSRRDHDARAEALLEPVAIAEGAVAAEEVPEERVVRKRRVRRADDRRRRDVGHAGDGQLRRVRQVRHPGHRRRGGAARRGRRLCLAGGLGRTCATASSAVRIRPVSTRPATNPTTRKTVARVRRLSMDDTWATGRRSRVSLLHVNLARGRRRNLGQRDGQHSVGEIGRDVLDVNPVGELERARERSVAPLDLMEVQDVARGTPVRPVAAMVSRVSSKARST